MDGRHPGPSLERGVVFRACAAARLTVSVTWNFGAFALARL